MMEEEFYMNDNFILNTDFIVTICIFFVIALSLFFVKINHFIGLRTKYAMSSEDIWKKSNYFLGELVLYATSFLLLAYLLSCPYMFSMAFFLSLIVIAVLLSCYLSKILYVKKDVKTRRIIYIRGIFKEFYLCLLMMFLSVIGYKYLDLLNTTPKMIVKTPFNIPADKMGILTLGDYVRDVYIMESTYMLLVSTGIILLLSIFSICKKKWLYVFYNFHVFLMIASIILASGVSSFVASYVAIFNTQTNSMDNLTTMMLLCYELGGIIMILTFAYSIINFVIRIKKDTNETWRNLLFRISI